MVRMVTLLLIPFAQSLSLACLLSSTVTLYHGTSDLVAHTIASNGWIPSLTRGRSHTAFGEGIYLSTDKNHAEGFAKRAVKQGGEPALISWDVPCDEWDHLVHTGDSEAYFSHFADADVVAVRKRPEFVLKQSGLDKLKHHDMSIQDITSGRDLGRFHPRIANNVFVDIGGKTSVRNFRALITEAERAHLRNVAISHLDIMELLRHKSFWAFAGAVAILEAFHDITVCVKGPVSSDIEKYDNRACENAFVHATTAVSKSAGGLVGYGVGGAVGTMMGGYVGAAVAATLAVGCPACAVVGAYIGGQAGAVMGSALGAQAFAHVGKAMARRLTRFLSWLRGGGICRAAEVLGHPCGWGGSVPPIAELRSAYRQKARMAHPDITGTEEEMIELNLAMDEVWNYFE
eukprot:GEMP01019094.1.p1 GENE.GEMP01019094.1~~GEMP01019094.1.p1  ORF type:complete len:402 (+),score=91.18 GEMP01019094.1:94-1299(+)